ncbi:hypothetical protein [Streptomyces sp. V1I6]|uniref:hypothetical protein n=1 Tax=Streptomyces sp. V1I6 TaxID=3042273 RepID=UPI0027884070|nr:hypothetical protein [Streptomyces sp. V1I6]MDQ0844633.1 hypothetical protein [Streptomyces sp. V1I6]
MRTRLRHTALLVLPLSLALAACGAEADEPTAAGSPEAAAQSSAASEPAKAPESAEDFIDLAEKAMAEESAWSFSVKGEEGLTSQGQKSAATYEGTVQRAVGRAALHSQGVSTSSKGKKKTEELYVIGEAGHLKEGTADWKAVSPADPEMRNKADDPIAVIHEFRMYAQAAGGDVKVTEKDGSGTVKLRVTSDEQKLSAVQQRAWAKKAKREFEPTAGQLRKAGIPVDDARLTLSGLEEVLVLDAKTYRIKSHRLDFGFLIPYNGQDMAFEQQVTTENQGVYDGRIELPADLRR